MTETESIAAAGQVPQRSLLTSRRDIVPAVEKLLGASRRTVRAIDRTGVHFDLSSSVVCARIERLLLSNRRARFRLLVDDDDWIAARAARLKLLQRNFPHALELRVAASDDPVQDDCYLLGDAGHMLALKSGTLGLGDLWLNNEPHAQPWLAAFDRRWEAAAHNVALSPLGL